MDITKLAIDTGLHDEIPDMIEAGCIRTSVGLTDVEKTLPKKWLWGPSFLDIRRWKHGLDPRNKPIYSSYIGQTTRFTNGNVKWGHFENYRG